MAALSMSNIADAEHALSAPLNNAEAIYRANLDMKGFHQEVMRVVLLDLSGAEEILIKRRDWRARKRLLAYTSRRLRQERVSEASMLENTLTASGRLRMYQTAESKVGYAGKAQKGLLSPRQGLYEINQGGRIR
jgi:hypothetical protein